MAVSITGPAPARPRPPGAMGSLTVGRGTAVGILVLMLSACADGAPVAPPNVPPSAAATAAEGERAATARTFFSAYGGGDAGPLIERSSPGSPAHAYAEYWREVIRSGRTSAVPARVDASGSRAVLRYPDGSTYRFDDLRYDPQARLVSWTNVPGGALERRIVTRQRGFDLGPLRLRVLHQFRTPDGDLRVTLAVRNRGTATVNLARRAPRSYVSPGGRHAAVTVGFGPHTGVVPVAAGTQATVLVSARHAEPGGRLGLLAYDNRNAPRGEIVAGLPAEQTPG